MYNTSLHTIALLEVAFEIEKEIRLKGLTKHFYDVIKAPRSQKSIIDRYLKQKQNVYEELYELAEKEWDIDLNKIKSPLPLGEDQGEGIHV